MTPDLYSSSAYRLSISFYLSGWLWPVACRDIGRSIGIWGPYLLVGGVGAKALEGHWSSWRYWLELSSKVTFLLEMFQLSSWKDVGSETLGSNGIATHEPWDKGYDSDVCNSQAHITQWRTRTSRRHWEGEGRIVCKNEGMSSLLWSEFGGRNNTCTKMMAYHL